MKRFLILTLALATTPFLSAQPTPEELLANPQYAEKDVKPTFQKVTAEELQQGIKVVSARNNAWFGFNTPVVQIHLPRADNNVYASIEFSDAKLYDAKGEVVPYEREDGFYLHEESSSETRFASAEGIVEFARAVGSIAVRYPASVRTTRLKVSDAKAIVAAGLSIDGPFVKVFERSGVVEEPFSSAIQSIRSWDSKGRRLERVQGYYSSGFEDDQNFYGRAFHGAPATIELDVAEEWLALDIAYELPPAPKLSDSASGVPVDLPAVIADTPGGRITITAKKALSPSVLGEAASLSQDEIMARLEKYQFREVTVDTLFNAIGSDEIEAVRLLLAAGLSPDSQHQSGLSPLAMASSIGRDAIAMLLVDAGADVNAKDMNDSTPLIWAAGRCSATELVKKLIAAGARVDATAKGSATPMMMASVMQCQDNVGALKAAGAAEWKAGE